MTATGEGVTASAEENAELFWGIRGAGANFGIVTSLEYDLHPVGELYGGELIHPGFRDFEALRTMVDLAPDMPGEVRLMAAMVTAPHAPFVPPEAQGKPVCVLAAAHCGPVEEGERVLAPLREFGPPAVDKMREQSYVELQRSVDKMIPPGRMAYVKSDFLGRLDDRALEILAEHHAGVTSPYCQILLHQMGGAIARVPADATAFANRDAEWMLTVAAIWVDPTEAPEPHLTWARALWAAMRPWATGTYVNHLGDEGEQRVREAYGAAYPVSWRSKRPGTRTTCSGSTSTSRRRPGFEATDSEGRTITLQVACRTPSVRPWIDLRWPTSPTSRSPRGPRWASEPPHP